MITYACRGMSQGLPPVFLVSILLFFWGVSFVHTNLCMHISALVFHD